MLTQDVMLEKVLIRQALYRLFAWLFLTPDGERLPVLQRGAAELLEDEDLWEQEAHAPALRELLRMLTELDEDATRELRREYTRLFVVKPLAPPYESVYTAPVTEARGWISTRIERIYARHGLAVSGLNELPDHIAVELEFISFLCEREADALREGDVEGAGRYREEGRSFISKHLRIWLPRLREKVIAAYPEGVYAEVLDVLMGLI